MYQLYDFSFKAHKLWWTVYIEKKNLAARFHVSLLSEQKLEMFQMLGVNYENHFRIYESESEAYLGSVEVDTQLAQLVHVVHIDFLLPQQVGHLMSQCPCDFAIMSASPRWRTSQKSTSSEGWLQADRLRLAWGVSWYLVEPTCERNPKNKYGMRISSWDGMTILWDCFSPCERRQEWGSSRLHWIGPFSTVCTPDITPLAWEDNIEKRLSFYTFALSHLFRGDVVHCLLVTATTKRSERKITSGHMVESHLIERISRIRICEGADIDC